MNLFLQSPTGMPTSAADLPVLPVTAFTKDGQRFDPSDEVWRLRKKAEGGNMVTLAWRTLTNLSPRFVHLAKYIIASKSSGYAAGTLGGQFAMLVRLSEWSKQSQLEWSHIDLAYGREWLAHQGAHTANMGGSFSRFRVMYEYGATVLRHPDFSESTYLHLSSLRARGNAKGAAVRAADPKKGHLTPPEIESILRALALGAGNERDRAAVWLCLQTGRNALQYSLLRESDLTRVRAGDDSDQQWIYTVHFPRVKKRSYDVEIDASGLERPTRRRMPIDRGLGNLLWSLRLRQPSGRLLWWLNQDSPESDLAVRMKKWAFEAGLISPRTDRHLVLNARRFRVTLATQAADQGASMEHIAALLDHEDLQNVKVYVDQSPRFLERAEKEIDAIYDPMVRRFRGEILLPEEAARRHLPVIPGIASHLPMLNLGGIGACGHKSLCRLAPPLTCYGCESFKAFRNGPHAEVVAALEGAMVAMDHRIALQLAPALAAAREVVALLTQNRAEAMP